MFLGSNSPEIVAWSVVTPPFLSLGEIERIVQGIEVNGRMDLVNTNGMYLVRREMSAGVACEKRDVGVRVACGSSL